MENLHVKKGTSRATLGKLPAQAEKLESIVQCPLETREYINPEADIKQIYYSGLSIVIQSPVLLIPNIQYFIYPQAQPPPHQISTFQSQKLGRNHSMPLLPLGLSLFGILGIKIAGSHTEDSVMNRFSQKNDDFKNYYSFTHNYYPNNKSRAHMNSTHSSGDFRKTIKNYSYFLNDVIGKGYSSTVYNGINQLNGEKVAIKVIELKFIKDQVTKKLLQTELECIKKIKHRNLLRFIESYQTANNIYIITEYCDGGDLQRQLKLKGRFTESDLASFFAQFYAGYTSLLQSGFIHRDIKPANILIRKGKIRIADFGIVKKISENPKDQYNVGTLLYMSPQSISSNVFTEKSDVWSIGIMCYQLTHGKFPWKSNSNDKKSIMAQVLNTNITFDSGWLSIDCIRFISQCLDKNQSSRISVAEMMGHPWMQKVIPLMKPNKVPKSVMNINANQVKTQEIRPILIQKEGEQNYSKITFQNVEIGKKSSSLTHINYKQNSSPSLNNQSPIKVPTLKFIYKNQNDLNSQNTAESSFQKMRQKIIGNQISMFSPLLPEAKVKEQTNSTVVESQILNLVNVLFKFTKKIEQTFAMIQNRMIEGALKNQIHVVLLVQLIANLRQLENMAKYGENVYGVAGWESVQGNAKWKNYVAEVMEFFSQHRERYERQLYFKGVKDFDIVEHGRQRRFSGAMKSILEELRKIVSKNISVMSIPAIQEQVKQQLLRLINLLDRLVSLYQFEELMFYKGWEYFKSSFEIDSIIDQQDVNRLNYQQIWGLLSTKIQIFRS